MHHKTFEYRDSIAYLTDDFFSILPADSHYDFLMAKIEDKWTDSSFFKYSNQKAIIEETNKELESEGIQIQHLSACITSDMEIALYIAIQSENEFPPNEYFNDERIAKAWEITIENLADHLLTDLRREWKSICHEVCFPEVNLDIE